MTTAPVMTITDEQIAEIEAEARWCYRASISSEVEPDELLALISRLRAAEKDAERYRFLKEKSPDAHMWSDESIDTAMEQSK